MPKPHPCSLPESFSSSSLVNIQNCTREICHKRSSPPAVLKAWLYAQPYFRCSGIYRKWHFFITWEPSHGFFFPGQCRASHFSTALPIHSLHGTSQAHATSLTFPETSFHFFFQEQFPCFCFSLWSTLQHCFLWLPSCELGVIKAVGEQSQYLDWRSSLLTSLSAGAWYRLHSTLKVVYEKPHVKVHWEGTLSRLSLTVEDFTPFFSSSSWRAVLMACIWPHDCCLVRDTLYQRLCCRTAAEHMERCQQGQLRLDYFTWSQWICRSGFPLPSTGFENGR